nr:MAG TPA: hypothetical protein [Caudoviricetes sp.]
MMIFWQIKLPFLRFHHTFLIQPPYCNFLISYHLFKVPYTISVLTKQNKSQ